MCRVFGTVELLLGGLSGGVVRTFSGVVTGLGLASLILYMDKRVNARWVNLSDDMGAAGTGQGHVATQVTVLPPPVMLQECMARPEYEVSLLRRQLVEIRGGTFAAPADTEAAAVESPSIATGALPAVESLAASVPTPQVSVPQPTSQPVSQPVPVLASHGPDWVERAVDVTRDWLLGGNSMTWVGILVLFFGVVFLLKHAMDNSLLSVEFRLVGVMAGAIVLFGIGWCLHKKRSGYALVLQSGGVGVLYLTVFATTRVVPLLNPGMASPLLVLIYTPVAGLAVRQNAPALAFTGSVGGFLAPILIPAGQNSYVASSNYYALLNADIFVIAWFRAQQVLNLLSSVFMFGITIAWGMLYCQLSLLASTEPLLIFFFLMYVSTALLAALRRHVSPTNYADSTLVFGAPLVAMGLQTRLVHRTPSAMVWNATALTVFYLGVAGWLAPRRANLGLLYKAMFALDVIFIALVIPLAFDGRTASTV